jgi:hypothetical protein
MEAFQGLAASERQMRSDSITWSSSTVAQQRTDRVGNLQWGGLVAAVEAVVGALWCINAQDCAADQLPTDTYASCSDDELPHSLDLPTLDWGQGEWPVAQQPHNNDLQQDIVLLSQPSW